mgnify:CR=1 FL=1
MSNPLSGLLGCAHSRTTFPMHDPTLKQDMVVCLDCGDRRRSKIQFRGKYAGGGRWTGDPIWDPFAPFRFARLRDRLTKAKRLVRKALYAIREHTQLLD